MIQMSMSNNSETSGPYFKVGVHSPLQKVIVSPTGNPPQLNAIGQHENNTWKTSPDFSTVDLKRKLEETELITYLMEQMCAVKEMQFFFWKMFIPNYVSLNLISSFIKGLIYFIFF